MRKALSLALVMVLAGTLCGCQNTKSRAVEGAVIGGVLGAAAGGIIGHQSHSGGEGAAIGAAVGALGGAVVGSQIEKPTQGYQQPAPAQTQQPVAQTEQTKE